LSRVTARGWSARANLDEVLEKIPKERLHYKVVDIYEAAETAEEYRIVATPTIIKIQPQPMRKVIGDCADGELVWNLLGLDRTLKK